jgi:hypothetical protein
MLIQKTIRTARAQLVAFAFGTRAAKPGTVGGRLLFRLFSRRALPELFQINQVPHVASVMLIAGWQQQAEGAWSPGLPQWLPVTANNHHRSVSGRGFELNQLDPKLLDPRQRARSSFINSHYAAW